MSNEIVTTSEHEAAIIESVVIGGDLSKLSPTQRVTYYRQVCGSMGLNYLTRPFDYITLNGKLTLYARKDAADQLRKINSVSIGKPDIQFVDDLILVTVEGEDKTGRKDAEVGVVKKGDMQGNLPNAIMKAVTKAKRRLTLSLCGLGWLDETEVETIPGARLMPAEIVEAEYIPDGEQPEPPTTTMTLETAENVTSSEGKRYGDLDNATLAGMATSIAKKIAKNGMTPQETETARMKLDAIKVVLAARAQQPA